MVIHWLKKKWVREGVKVQQPYRKVEEVQLTDATTSFVSLRHVVQAHVELSG